MTPLAWVFLGLVALVTTVITLTTTDDQTAIITGLMATTGWALWAYSALNITVYSQGTLFTESYPSMALFGLLLAVPNLFVALTGPLALAKDPRELAGEVTR